MGFKLILLLGYAVTGNLVKSINETFEGESAGDMAVGEYTNAIKKVEITRNSRNRVTLTPFYFQKAP